MKIKCEYCGNYIEDTNETCPNCGAPNEHLQRQAIGIPRTIEELKQWYKEHNLPPEETTRFFIGKNYTGAKAFGIYQENNGNFVVYKNKADSVRTIRYRGKDEAYAVNELYMKLKEEIVNQKRRNANANANTNFSRSDNDNYYRDYRADLRRQQRKRDTWDRIARIAVVIIVIYAVLASFRPAKGYYYYNHTYYYYQGWTWYEYDDSTGWYKSSAPFTLMCNASTYYKTKSYSSNYDIDDFSDTSYYRASSSSSGSSSSSDSSFWDSDWDSGSSWDSSDSWDSGGTDWSSDW